jgi:hypothetical protein
VLVAFSTAAPAAGPSFHIVESHGVQRWSYFMLRNETDDVGGSELVMRATLEADIGKASSGCTLVQLGTPTAAIEEAFNRTMRDADLARAMKLPGALSARRYRLEPMVGRCTWESLTVYGFEGDDPEALTQALVDAADVWDGDPSCIVMRVEPAGQTAERA